MLFFFLFIVSFCGLLVQSRRHADAVERIKRLNGEVEDRTIKGDDDVMNYLEAAAVVSPIAQRLLDGATEKLDLIKHVEAVEPAWYHDTAARCNPTDHWKIFLADIKRETCGSAALNCLRHWVVDNSVRFTHWEQGQVVDMFETADDRQAAREIFALSKREKGAS